MLKQCLMMLKHAYGCQVRVRVRVRGIVSNTTFTLLYKSPIDTERPMCYYLVYEYKNESLS